MCVGQREPIWSPGLSGGVHHPEWPTEVTTLISKLLSPKPPCSYNAVASELLRRLNFKTGRASVRRGAIENHLAPDTRYKAPAKPVKRWQARDYGALWQYDASPHAWLPDCSDKQVLLDILDDATRLNTGARPYHAESLLATSISHPASFKPTACRWRSMSTTTPSFIPTTQTPSPNSVRPYTSTASNCSTLPHPKPKAKSSADTTTGRNAWSHSWRMIASSSLLVPIICSTNSSLMPISRNPPRTGPDTTCRPPPSSR